MTKDEFVKNLVVALIDNGSFNMSGREFLSLANLVSDEVEKLRPFVVKSAHEWHDEYCVTHEEYCKTD